MSHFGEMVAVALVVACTGLIIEPGVSYVLWVTTTMMLFYFKILNLKAAAIMLTIGTVFMVNSALHLFSLYLVSVWPKRER